MSAKRETRLGKRLSARQGAPVARYGRDARRPSKHLTGLTQCTAIEEEHGTVYVGVVSGTQPGDRFATL